MGGVGGFGGQFEFAAGLSHELAGALGVSAHVVAVIFLGFDDAVIRFDQQALRFGQVGMNLGVDVDDWFLRDGDYAEQGRGEESAGYESSFIHVSSVEFERVYHFEAEDRFLSAIWLNKSNEKIDSTESRKRTRWVSTSDSVRLLESRL